MTHNGDFHDRAPMETMVLRMRGLPFAATCDDVRSFFNEFPVDPAVSSVVIIPQGLQRGEGYVRFVNAQVASAALAHMNKRRMGERYIELFPAEQSALDLQYSSQLQMLSETRFFIRLRGLPFQAGEGNVREFLSPLGERQLLAVHMCQMEDGRFNGNAFVEVASQESVDKALNELNKQMLGRRYVEVFQSNLFERDTAIASEQRRRRQAATANGAHRGGAPHESNPRRGERPQDETSRALNRGTQPNRRQNTSQRSAWSVETSMTHAHNPVFHFQPPQRPTYPVVRIRGLPYSANESTIADFLHGVNIPPQGVHMVYDANERPTGEAFVEVFSEADVQAALALDHGLLGRRYIEVFRSSQADMQRLQMGDAPTPDMNGGYPYGPMSYGGPADGPAPHQHSPYAAASHPGFSGGGMWTGPHQ